MKNLRSVKFQEIQPVVAIVPVVAEETYEASFETLFSFLVVVGFILSMILFKKLLKISNNEELSIFNMYQIILGSQVPGMFNNFRLKLIFLILSAFGFFVASDFLMDLTALKYVSHKRPLIKNINDAEKANMSFFIPLDEKTLSEFFSSNYVDDYVAKYRKYVKYIPLNIDVSKVKNGIVIISNMLGKIFLDQRSDKTEEFEFVDLGLPVLFEAYYSEKNSPYIEKFDHIQTWLLESGICIHTRDRDSQFNNKALANYTEQNDSALIRSLITVMVVGSLLSTIALIAELILDWHRNKKRSRVVYLNQSNNTI